MLKTSEQHNINYLAKIVKIDNIRRHENADRLQCTTIDGNNIIVGLDNKLGDIGIYFPLECKINLEFLRNNNLFSHKEQNSDQTKAGFFDQNGRVRAVKLRGEKSEGFWLPITSFSVAPFNIDQADVKNGIEFDTINDILLVSKYIPTKQQANSKTDAKQQNKKKKIESIIIPEHYHRHIDTPLLGKSLFRLHPDTFITISQKLHGTSFIVSNVLTKRKLSWWERIARYFGASIVDTQYRNIYGTRNTVKNDAGKPIYGDDLWTQVNEKFAPYLEKGMTIYGEAVGYQPSGKWIQKGYDYGCNVGQHETYVYRITWNTPDGRQIEWNSRQIKKWCDDRGFKVVPQLWSGNINQLPINVVLSDEDHLAQMRTSVLQYLQKTYLDKPCAMCKTKVWDEGIVLRIEDSINFDVFKLKSFKFLEHESKQLDTGEVDIESDQTDEVIDT